MPHTVFVTGATGYIAKHIIAQLLNEGHTVIGSARSVSRDAEMRAALTPVLKDKSALDRYRTVALDLAKDDGWSGAMNGADVLMHTASPFPIIPPKTAAEIVRPAVDGTLRALRAAKAAGIKRVVMTSSSVSIAEGHDEGKTLTEADWSVLEDGKTPAYAQSKTLAERAAWDFIRNDTPDMQLAVVNPSLVVGAPLDKNFGTSIQVLERLLKGQDPMLPRVGFGACDVRDVADAHVKAMDADDATGNRHIVFDQFYWFSDLAALVKEAVPEAKTPTRVAPDFVIRLLAIFDRSVRTIAPDLGKTLKMDSSRLRALLGRDLHDTRDAVKETAKWLRENGVA